jgi:pyrroline-5-carboxylate reductase
VAPAEDVARVIPLPSVARRQGITPVHPPNTAAQALFDRLGEAAAVEDARAFDAFSATTATAAAHYAQLGAIGAWLEAQGVPEAEATRYVASMYTEIGEQLRAGRPFEELARDHTTAGGLNEQFRAGFEQAGVFDEVRRGLDAVLRRVSGA